MFVIGAVDAMLAESFGVVPFFLGSLAQFANEVQLRQLFVGGQLCAGSSGEGRKDAWWSRGLRLAIRAQYNTLGELRRCFSALSRCCRGRAAAALGGGARLRLRPGLPRSIAVAQLGLYFVNLLSEYICHVG